VHGQGPKAVAEGVELLFSQKTLYGLYMKSMVSCGALGNSKIFLDKFVSFNSTLNFLPGGSCC
jgi:hypothetical protein